MKQIHITLITISASLLFSGFVFFWLFDAYIWSYDPDWRGLFHSKNPNKDKILIIGSSQVFTINATYVSKFLEDNEKYYEVYNLADPGQLPDRRLKYLDSMISAEPTMVFYGLGMMEFQKKPPYEISEAITKNDQFIKVMDPGNFFWYTIKYFTDENLAIGAGASPKDRTALFLKFILRGPEYTYSPFMKYFERNIKDIDQISAREFTGFDLSNDNMNVKAVHKIIDTLQENNIKIVIFSVPNIRQYLDQISDSEMTEYLSFLNEISKKTDVYYLHDRYADMNIWTDSVHIAVHKNSTVYTTDMSKIILEEIQS